MEWMLSFTIGAIRNLFKDCHESILDTGTNILLLPDEGFASMKQEFINTCNTGGAKLLVFVLNQPVTF